MASRKLFEDILPSSCSCKNVCNRTTSRRGGCPCLTAEVYCSSSCSCGTARQQCANRPGKGGDLDKQLGISSEDSDPEPDVDSDAEPDWLMVSFEDGEDLRVCISDLNESLQATVERQHPMPHVSESPTKDSEQRPTQAEDPLYRIRDASRNQLMVILEAIVGHSPDMSQFLHIHPVPEPSEAPLPDQVPGSAPEPAPAPEPAGIPSWCKCGMCHEMPTQLEQRCCRRSVGQCTLHTAAADLNAAVLDRRMLLVCIRDRNEVFVLNDDPSANECLRHMAYRRFVLWTYGHLGAYTRRVIPSCVVWAIRNKYPSPDQVYTGFVPSRLN